MNQVYFKLEKDTLTERMFAMMQNDDPIFRPNSNSEISYYKFINYFKGLAIQSGKDNNCLLSLEMIPDSLYMRVGSAVICEIILTDVRSEDHRFPGKEI